jgi:hypothetical protein
MSRFAASCAWPLKRNDTDDLIKQGEEFANDKLEEFKEAAKSGNNAVLIQLMGSLFSKVKEVQGNNEVLLPRIIKATGWIKSLTDGDLGGFFRGRALNFLVSTIDGNRDNFSYYWFDASAKWIERRANSTSSQLKTDLDTSRTMIIDARDDLDSHAQIFVQGIKKIKELSAGGKSGENAEQIRAVVADFEKMKQTIRLTEKTQAALDMIDSVIKSLKV